MVRWRVCLALAILLLLPVRAGAKGLVDDDDDEESGSRHEDGEEEDDNEDEDDDEDQGDKGEMGATGRRSPMVPSAKPLQLTRTTKKRPLECYVCAFKAETPLRACLDPAKYRVHTITCHNVEDNCFTSVISKGNSYDAVVRGCRSSCAASPETTCCEQSRCNNQAFAMPAPATPRALVSNSKPKTIPPSVFFFVTILLLLQTVGKVAFV